MGQTHVRADRRVEPTGKGGERVARGRVQIAVLRIESGPNGRIVVQCLSQRVHETLGLVPWHGRVQQQLLPLDSKLG